MKIHALINEAADIQEQIEELQRSLPRAPVYQVNHYLEFGIEASGKDRPPVLTIDLRDERTTLTIDEARTLAAYIREWLED